MSPQQIIDLWKQCVDVQKHFNDLIIKIRERAITVIGAGIVAAAFLIKDAYILSQPIRLVHLIGVLLVVLFLVCSLLYKMYLKGYVYNQEDDKNKQSVLVKNWVKLLLIPSLVVLVVYAVVKQFVWFQESLFYKTTIIKNPSLGGLTIIALSFIWLAFYLMDRFWYHRLLKGAVISAAVLEDIIFKKMPAINLPAALAGQPNIWVFDGDSIKSLGSGLGNEISENSSVYIGKFNKNFRMLRLDSSSKIDLYYLSIFLIIFSSGCVLVQNPEQILTSNDKIGIEKKYDLYRNRIDSLVNVVKLNSKSADSAAAVKDSLVNSLKRDIVELSNNKKVNNKK